MQSVDRHFNELLQELRVAQTGVQILFASLLGLAFTPRFPDLTSGQQSIYLVTLVWSAVSAALLIALSVTIASSFANGSGPSW